MNNSISDFIRETETIPNAMTDPARMAKALAIIAAAINIPMVSNYSSNDGIAMVQEAMEEAFESA